MTTAVNRVREVNMKLYYSVGLRPATSHPTRSRIPSCAGWAGPILRVLYIPHSIIILVYNVEILLIFHDHKIYGNQESVKWKHHLFYMYVLLNSVFIVSFWPFCPGMHPGIIGACKEDLAALATIWWTSLSYWGLATLIYGEGGFLLVITRLLKSLAKRLTIPPNVRVAYEQSQ